VTHTIGMGDCVRIPDGRIGRVREFSKGKYRVRVRRMTSATHQFLTFFGYGPAARELPERLDEPSRLRSLPQSHSGQDATTPSPVEKSTMNIQDRSHFLTQAVLTIGHPRAHASALAPLMYCRPAGIRPTSLFRHYDCITGSEI
jgi:hypothetical protein